MAETCIDYLLHFTDPTHPLNVYTFPDYPLASYAAEYWGHHLLLCDESTRLFDSAMCLMERGSAQYLALNHLVPSGPSPHRGGPTPSLPHLLHVPNWLLAGVKCLLKDHEVDTKELADALRAASHRPHGNCPPPSGEWRRSQEQDEDEDSIEDNALSVACMKGTQKLSAFLLPVVSRFLE
ncbi:hypothetical protein B0H13DRAFT_975675 [Mycena leptocephala]|nr:hypothetical protein B0H13DRAFT_975675 [Mycena leptocephala]